MLQALGVGETRLAAPRTCSVERSLLTPASVRRASQKSSASGEATRQTIRWTIPAPGAPRAAPGYSKNVKSIPGEPSSSP